MSNNEKKLTPYQQKEIDRINEAAEIRKRSEEELYANKAIQEYLANFNPDSVKTFIDHYLTDKTLWHQYGELYLRTKENHEMEWTEAANEHLTYIQQKKLFDLQCLWRAEKITLPGVSICFDFEIWERDILNCPFIDPITKEEVELYQEYLRGDNTDIESHTIFSFTNWQSYDDLKEAFESDNGSDNFPEWYDFYNNRRGTGVYLSLPNIRGEKEEEYLDLWRGHHLEEKKITTATQEALQQPDKTTAGKNNLPALSLFSTKETDYFVNTFEDKLTKKYYEACKWYMKNENVEEGIIEIAQMFLKSGERIPIESNDDWKEALFRASRKFKAAKISEAMEDAFEQYQLTLSMNIGFPKTADDFSFYESLKQTWVKNILQGRKLKGEPENLDF